MRPHRALVIQVPTTFDREFEVLAQSSPAFREAEVTRSPGTELRMIIFSGATGDEAESMMAKIDQELVNWQRLHGAKILEHDRVSGYWRVQTDKYFSSVPRFR
jgi:hypothetical protein